MGMVWWRTDFDVWKKITYLLYLKYAYYTHE